MKIYTALLLLVCMSAGNLSYAQKTTAEQDAVKKVIETETRAFYEGNYNAWADTWAHDTICYVMTGGPGSHNILMGWSQISTTYKGYMQNPQPIDEEQYKIYDSKYDYNYSINGNSAVVTFKEGKGIPETRSLEKINGTWKIKGITSVDMPSYKAIDAFNNIKAFEGKWAVDTSSIKIIPAPSWHLKTAIVDIHPSENGIEIISNQTGVYNNHFFITPIEKEQLVFNAGANEIQYFDVQKDGNGQTYTNVGKATSESAGSFEIKIPYPDKPTVNSVEASYTMNNDGSMLVHALYYGMDGKQTQAIDAKFVRQ